jgi:hypothetical protein
MEAIGKNYCKIGKQNLNFGKKCQTFKITKVTKKRPTSLTKQHPFLSIWFCQVIQNSYAWELTKMPQNLGKFGKCKNFGKMKKWRPHFHINLGHTKGPSSLTRH